MADVTLTAEKWGEGFAFFRWHSWHNMCDCKAHVLDARLQWSWGGAYR